jgi:hypothetical protein
MYLQLTVLTLDHLAALDIPLALEASCRLFHTNHSYS